MADIIIFPTRINKENILIERFLRKELHEFGLMKKMENEIIDGMKKFLYLLHDSFNFQNEQTPMFSTDQLMFIADKIHEYSNAIITERLGVEIELYNLRHRDELEN